MLSREGKQTDRGAVGAEFIGYNRRRREALLLQEFPHQPNCRPSVPAGLNQEIQDFALTVHGTPEIELPPSNYDDHLVQVPAFGRSWPPTLNPPRIGPTEFQDPSSNCLIRDVETTLGKQVLNVPIAQRETAIEPDGMLDDDRWKAVTTVGYLAHPETLKHRPCRSHAVNVTMPSSRPKALAPSIPMPPLADAMDAVHLSVDRFCLLAGVEALAEMMEEDATTVCGARHRRHGDRRGYRWGRTHSEIGYHGGKVKVARPRVRDRAGKEVSLESWQALRDGNLLLEWALNLMVLNVSTRKYHRAVRLPEGDLAKARGDGTSKSAVSRRFVALSRKKMKAWLASDLSELDLLVIQIDGLHVGDHVLMAAIGVDGNGDKHVLAVVEGATENTVVVQALIDNLLARGLDPTLPRLFIVDGAKALSKAIRNTFGVAATIQRCQVHKGRNIIERLPQHLHASVKKALRQAWDQDDANKAERLLRNLVRRLEHEEPGVSGSILEGLEEILTVIRLGLPHELRRSLACTNIVENALGTVRQVTRNVKRWRHAEMALRWTAAGLLEAQKTFRRLKAYRQLPILRNALQEHLRKAQADSAIETIMKAA